MKLGSPAPVGRERGIVVLYKTLLMLIKNNSRYDS